MSPSQSVSDRELRFAELYDSAYLDVLRFAQRRSPPGRAEDIAHEAFLVAWRRFDTVPTQLGEARAWLFGVARNCVLSERRSRQRYEQLGVRILQTLPADLVTGSEESDLRLDLIAAWQQLTPDQQEVLSFTLWEELSAADAGRVLGITAAAYRLRLHRARRALQRHLHPAALASPPMRPADLSEMTS